MMAANRTKGAVAEGRTSVRQMGPLRGNTPESALEPQDVYTKQQRIAELARQMPQARLWNLAQYVDEEWMHEAYRRIRKDAAEGVDGVTAQQYEMRLDENIRDLLERFKSGLYVAPPVRRVYIPKEGGAGGEKRPIGIPTLEDKLLQRAVIMVLEPIYEQEFLDCSHAFRPKRSVHGALEALWHGIMAMGGCWVLKIDIRSYFDTVKHGFIREFVRKRVGDGVILRVLGKWLKAGIMEKGELHYADEGTPQGGIVSPLISNLYLHEVLDTWFEREIRPLLRGASKILRYADDALLLFANREDALRVREVVVKRLAKYGLEVREDKTSLLRFVRPTGNGEEPEVFDFLGFTHYWGNSRKGRPIVKRRTAGKKFRVKVRVISDWCRKNRHKPLGEQWKDLCRKVTGHYVFYGITSNGPRLKEFLHCVVRLWHKWLNRRNRNRQLTWEKFNRILERYPLPQPKIYHSVALAKP
jgi:RNA-directed DNA polymerase